ncbi:hypothetical protein Q9290_02205 [Oceanimonas sp. CHS3-5]|uniref:hypothetical protein n=1 Tax=Oceanimonas sp. CHS3-5 TaxID=3068186 RepID=UPI0027400A57|nr:hypothetical protein [Oceanimonas sp. CHS3-5]MDP5291111.1 hypothetical protein [Oceanimonas sp. CHS3-5]
MLDRDFKKFPHRLAQGDAVASRGSNIANNGNYRPDIAIKNVSGAIHLILESERKSERKAFIGALVHAAKYAEDSNAKITLVFVMKETDNQTTVAQVSTNIRPYYRWLHSLGAKNLNRVFLISDAEYDNSADANEVLLSAEFIARCTAL